MHMVVVGENKTYREFVRKLRNDKRLKKSWVNHTNITKEQQKEYMDKYGNQYFIFINGEKPIGFIGIVDEDLRLAVLPEYQNAGVGQYMLDFIISSEKKFKVRVRKDNIDSQKFFERNKIKFELVD